MIKSLVGPSLETLRAGLRNSTGLRSCLTACVVGGLMTGVAEAAPQQGTVTGGSSTITQSGNATTIHQTTERSSIDWQSFSIGANEQVTFVQPNSSAISLDRVMGPGVSTIAGSLTANGQVVLINSNGILFAQGASVNLAGLIATTSNISDSDFMGGKLGFNQASANNSATVINQGVIDVASGGYAVLSAAAVANTGTIRATLGKVVLAGATAFTVDFDGDGLLQYAVTQGVGANPGTSTLVEQSGLIAADGGQVLMTARAAKGVIQHAINMDGMTEANAVSRTANGALIVGAVTLDGGTTGAVEVTGSIQATNTAGAGGTVQVLGENVSLTGSGNIQAWGSTGGGTVLFGGNEHGAGPEANAESAYVAAGTTITASATTSGNGGKVVVWSDAATWFAGTINVEGGAAGGNGGFAETSGKDYLGVAGSVDAKALHGKPGQWLLDPDDVIIESNGGTVTNGTFSGGMFFAGTGSLSTIDPSVITGALNAGTNVNISTSGGSGGTGNITVASPITMNASNPSTTGSLELIPYIGGTIFINAPISSTSGLLGLNLQGSVSINANVTANYGLVATANLSTDTFTQAAGTTITTGSAGFNLTYNSISLTSVVSSNPYASASILPWSSGGSIGIGTGTGVTGSNGLVLSSASLSALSGFYNVNIGNTYSVSSIVFGGSVTMPNSPNVSFDASNFISVSPGTQISFPAPTNSYGDSPVVSLITGGEGSISVGSGSMLNLGVTTLQLKSDAFNFPSSSWVTGTTQSAIFLDTASASSLGIGTGASGQTILTQADLAGLSSFSGLFALGLGGSLNSIDIAGSVTLPASTQLQASYEDCDCSASSIVLESSARVQTAVNTAASAAYKTGLELATGPSGSITQNAGATITIGVPSGYTETLYQAGTGNPIALAFSTSNLALNGAPGSLITPAVNIGLNAYGQTVTVGSGGVITQSLLNTIYSETGSTSSTLLVVNGNSGITISGSITLPMPTTFYDAQNSYSTTMVSGNIIANSGVSFFAPNFVEAQGASINASLIGIYGQGGATVSIAGSLVSTGLEIEAGLPGTIQQTSLTGSNGVGKSGSTISLASTASIVTTGSDVLSGRIAETVLFTLPGGSITIAPGASINFGGGNLALVADTLSVLSAPGAITGTSRVIISPSSSDGFLYGPFSGSLSTSAPDFVVSPKLFATEGASSQSIGIGTADGGWIVSQQLINALSTGVGRLQIGLQGTSAGTRLAGTINFPTETGIWGGDVLVDSSAIITVTGTTTFDVPGGAPDGLILNAVWDGQYGGTSLNLSNHGNIGIEPGAVINVAGALQMDSQNYCSTACNYHPGVLLDGTITASSILYFDTGVGAHVIVGPNAVLTTTGSAATGGIDLAPDVGGEISLIGGASINTGAAPLTLTTDKLDLAVSGGSLILTDSGPTGVDVTTTIPLSSTGTLSIIAGGGVFVDTAEFGQAGLGNGTAAGATIGLGTATGTLQLSSAVLSALSVGAGLTIGDSATPLTIGEATVTGTAPMLLTGSEITFAGGTFSTQSALTIGGRGELAASTTITAGGILAQDGFDASSSGVDLSLIATNGGSVYVLAPSKTVNGIQGVDALTATGTIVSVDGLNAQSATLNGGVTANNVDVGSLTLTGPAAVVNGTIGGISGSGAVAFVTAPATANDVINGCQIGTACAGARSTTTTTTTGTGISQTTKVALQQVAASAANVPQSSFLVSTTEGLGSLDLTGSSGFGAGTRSSSGGTGGSQGSEPGGPDNPANSPSGQAAAGPKPAQPTVLMPGKLVYLPPRAPEGSGIAGFNGDNSSLGNNGRW